MYFDAGHLDFASILLAGGFDTNASLIARQTFDEYAIVAIDDGWGDDAAAIVERGAIPLP